uniref:Alpha-mannosidase n=1 Tax=Heliothis virescens TaxID=7102 RepID=A0A2A4JU30_HELVI
MQALLLLLCAVSSVYPVPVDLELLPKTNTCGYDSCPTRQPGVLNVHIVPHTHDDVGWLKTVDQYYYGSKNSIQKAGVQYILDSVIKELWEDPKRRFIYVETAFFWKWWVRQTPATQSKVHTLVNQGRLQMVGGAWSMNDEAASHYQSTIDQFTWGLKKLNQTFGHCGRPRVGWQIDPFGHSREFASLLSMMGYDGLFLGRIDYQDKRNRLLHRNMEMVWRGDDALGKSSDIFTGVLHNTYSPPPGFCFDVLCADEPIIDDPDSPMYNVESKISIFLDDAMKQAKYYRTNNVIFTMGGDFTYQDAGMWYTNLDKLIQYANLKAAKDNMNITLFYSTPNCYLKAIKDANPTLPTKKDDFFPYASDSTAYWTGYFTSRPTTKYFEREGNNYLQMVKQLQVLANLEKHNEFVLNELKSAMGVMQHHDAITGTEKQHVTHDYERLLNQAIDDALIIAKQAFNKLTQKDDTKPPLFDFQRCHLNESSCHVSENSDKFVVTIYNPLGWSVREPIRIPVGNGQYEVYDSDGKQIKTQLVPIPNKVKQIPTRVSKATQEIVFIIDLKPLSYKSIYIKKINRTKRNTNNYDFYSNINNNFWGHIKEPYINKIEDVQTDKETIDTIKAIPFAPVHSEDISLIEDRETNLDILKDGKNDAEVMELEKFLKDSRRKGKGKDNVRIVDSYPNFNEDEMRMLADEPRTVEKFDDEAVIGNQFYNLDINTASGLINKVTLRDHTKLNFTINMYYYSGSCGDNQGTDRRSSGAYIFRPLANNPVKLATQRTELINGDLVKEFRVSLSPSGFTNTKVYDGLNFIETEWIVGPIPIDDEVGKEYVIKYETNILNNGAFYTDSNGRQILARKLNFRPQWNVTLAEPIPGNYYPVTNEIYIENKDLRVTVLPDRSEGGTSLIEGEVELMLHRRLLCDDAFGVGEALNETAKGLGLVVRGKHRVLISKDDITIKKNVLGLHLGPQLLFSDAKNIKYDEWLKLNNEYSFVTKELPNGVHLLTLEPFDSQLLIRLENYLDKSGSIEVDLKDIFKDITITGLKETMLAANIFVDEYDKWYWNNERKVNENRVTSQDLKVKLNAKQIRTFIANFEDKRDVKKFKKPTGMPDFDRGDNDD